MNRRWPFFLSRGRAGRFLLTIALMLTCLIGRTEKSAWGFDLEKRREYIGLNWTHYTNQGYLLFNLFGDTDFGNVRSIGIGHHFDHLVIENWTIGVTANNTLNDGWKAGFYFNKWWGNDFSFSYVLQPLTSASVVGFTGHFFERKIRASIYYDFDRDRTWLNASAPLGKSTRFFTSCGIEDGDITLLSGLTFSFVTGTRSTYQPNRSKPIEWLTP